ncbi:ABC transporter substrate-binding protein [Methanococcoides sp. SA1]|nr:ABC transporter substrate-binding protein [Methanococcoides sp. SA1]
MRYILIFLLTLFCLSTAQAQELQKIVLQLQWKHQFEFAGFYAAIHKGYYAQRDLQVELNEYRDGMDVVEEVLSGRAQYAAYHSAIVRARLEGKPVKLLANYFKRLPLVILSSPQINNLAGLRGKRLMMASKDLNSPLLKLAFEREGLQVGQDIEIVPHTFNADPFIQGKVDAMSAFITNEPFYIEQQNINFNIIELSDYMRSMGELYLFTSDAQAGQYPGRTQDFIEATNEGWRYALEHKEEIVDLILANYSQRKSREALLYEAEKTHDMIMPLPVPIGSLFKVLIEEVAALIMRQEGIEDKGYLRDFLFNSKVLSQEIELTPEEQSYLSSMQFHRQLSYGWMPFNLKNKDENIIGLSEDYWALIRDKLGLNERTGSPVLFAEVLKVMQLGQTDIYPSASRTKDRDAYSVFSDSYEEFPIAIATRKSTEFIFNTSTLAGQVVAVGKNYSAYHLLRAHYPEIKFLQVTNTKEALERVASGEAYAAVDILPVLQYQLEYLGSKDIKLAGITDVQFPVQVMVRKEHARLIPLINRAIAIITPEERSIIHRKWMMREIITAPDYTLLFKVLAGVFLLLVVILFWNRRLARELITRKQIEEQLRKLSEAVEQSHNTIVISDLDGNIEYVNPAFSRVTGYTSEEAIGQNPRILQSGYHDDDFYRVMWDTLTHNGMWQGEICNKRKDGSLYWEFATISTVKDVTGETTHYVAVKEDISDRKKAESDRLEHYNRLITFMETIPDALFVKDGTGHWLLTNQVARELFQVEKFPWQGKTDKELGLDRPDFREAHDACTLSDELAWKKMTISVDFEEISGADGLVHTYEVRKMPIFGPNKERQALVIIGRDITNSINAEKEKEELTKQLHRAKRLESIGLMAGGVAHDLNNILAGITGYPELMLYDLPPDSKLRKPIQAIQESGTRAATVVADLLTVARGVASAKNQQNLNLLIQEYLVSPECIELKSIHPNVTYRYPVEAKQATILCSQVHVRKCLMNLVTNASEAIVDKGTVSISTHNEIIDDDGGGKVACNAGEYVVLSVQDDGPGILENDLEHIFEPFYTRKKMGRSGTGLGLTVVWNTMQDHDGRVLVESSDKGTCFKLYFPVIKEEHSELIDSNSEEHLTCCNESILVVDDEPQLRDVASQMLQHLGYNVDSVCSGEMAIKFINENPRDLILIDMLMEPGMNGLQTYKEILKLCPDQKAVIASGFSMSDDIKETLKLGAGAFIKKPYSMEKLGLAVKEVLHGFYT